MFRCNGAMVYWCPGALVYILLVCCCTGVKGFAFQVYCCTVYQLTVALVHCRALVHCCRAYWCTVCWSPPGHHAPPSSNIHHYRCTGVLVYWCTEVLRYWCTGLSGNHQLVRSPCLHVVPTYWWSVDWWISCTVGYLKHVKVR